MVRDSKKKIILKLKFLAKILYRNLNLKILIKYIKPILLKRC